MTRRHDQRGRRLRMLLYSSVHPAHRGGVQTVCMRLGDHLRSRGHGVIRAWKAPNPRATDDTLFTLPLLVKRRGLPTLRSALSALRAFARVAVWFARTRPDLVNAHYLTAESTYFVLLKPFFGFKLVLSVHGSDVLAPKPHNARMLPRLLAHADVITTVSNLTASRVREFPGVEASRVRVIPNGVDHAFWSAAAGGANLSQRAPLVVAVGRLHPVKGQDVLLRAFRRVRDRISDARLVMIGDGGFRPELERIVSELDLADAVELIGQMPPEEVRTWFDRARVFALPSRSEGLPLSLLEAMAAGVPAVATAVGAVPDVLVPGTGLVVPAEDSAALGDALTELLGNTPLARGLRERAMARAAQFSAAEADRSYEDTFLEVAGGVGRRSWISLPGPRHCAPPDGR